jgi:hypothetical protein
VIPTLGNDAQSLCLYDRLASSVMRLFLHYLLSGFYISILASTNRYCRTGSENHAPDLDTLGPQEGNMNYLRFGIAKPWPPVNIPNKNQIRLIRYCFANAKAKAELDCPLQKGFNVWAQAIKTPASAENSHSLGWMEVHDGNANKDERAYPTCYLDDYKSKEEPGTWNAKVSTDALSIHLGAAEEAPYASTGYEFRKDKPGRHFIVMGSKSTEAHRVAREVSHSIHTRPNPPLSHLPTQKQIGHVLGMLHEHCRWDRDDHVLFRCDKLLGYQDALITASLAGHPDAAERLCTNQAFANEFHFEAGAQYIKNDAYAMIVSPIMDEGPFDLGSIMMYPSNAYAADPKCWEKSDASVCPLVAARFGSTRLINVNTAPSAGDVKFVKTWYKWIEGLGGLAVAEEQIARSAAVVGMRGGDAGRREAVRVHHVEIRDGNVLVREL